MKRILLTGAGGAIGVHVIAHIMHNTDWSIVALDSWRDAHKGYFDRIKRVCRDHPEWPARIKIFTHDLSAPFTPRELKELGEFDFLLNLASRSDVQNSIDDPESFVRNNIEIALTMVRGVRDGLMRPIVRDGKVVGFEGVFVQFSTDEVYGPAPRDGSGHKEGEPHRPSNPYSASKAMQEDYLFSAWRCYGIPLIVTNTMNNFGEMQAPSKFPAMIQQRIERNEEILVHANNDGESGTRYYLHSRNAADAIVFILRNVPVVYHAPGEIDEPLRFNIVGDKQVSNEELVQTIAKLMGKFAKYRKVNFHDHNPGHDMHYGLDGTKLRELGWKAPLSFEESLKNTIDWQQRNPEWMK